MSWVGKVPDPPEVNWMSTWKVKSLVWPVWNIWVQRLDTGVSVIGTLAPAATVPEAGLVVAQALPLGALYITVFHPTATVLPVLLSVS
jgi:hypothetical protein